MPILLLKTLRDLRHRTLRSILTLFGIAIGVAGIVAISYTARNLAVAQTAVYADASQADLNIGTGDISPTIRNVLERLPNVALVEGRVVYYTRASLDPAAARWPDLRLTGIADFNAVQINRIELLAGRYPEAGEIAIDASARSLIPAEIGDIVYTRSRVGDRPLARRVVGFTRTPAAIDASILNQAFAYAPIADVRKEANLTGDNRLLFRLEAPDEAGTTASRISRILGTRGIPIGFVIVRDPENAEGRRELATLLQLLTAFSILGGVLSGFLVSNTISAIMAEEMRQVGIMKSLGAGRLRLIRTYLLPALLLGGAGTALGLPLGVLGGGALGTFLANLLGLRLPPPNLAPREPLLALTVGVGVPVVAAAIPAWRGAGTPVSGLVRSYGVAAARGRRFLDRLLRPVGRLSALGLMALRAVGRRPARSGVTILVIAISAAAFLATQTLDASVRGTVDNLYGIYAADAFYSVGRTVTPRYATDLSQLPDVARAEAWSRTAGFVGPLNVDVWGVPSDTELYRYRLLAGRWYSGQPREVVVSADHARRDSITVDQLLQVDIGDQRRPFTVVGIVDDESTYLGSVASGKLFMTVEDVSRLTYYGDGANLFALSLTRHDPAGVDEALARIELATRDVLPGTFAAYADKESTLQAVRVLTLLLRAMVTIVGIVGAAGSANTLILNVTERRREIGILRAIGAGRGHLLRLLLAEGLALGLLGLAVGSVLGYLLARALVDLTGASLFRLDFLLTPAIAASTAILAIILSIIASVGPGLLAAHLRPIEALRYE
ncbi:MAG: ABC transporter permease [Thermomicrobiales bacterium]